MLYLDDYYKIDCENKIKYDHLSEVNINGNKFEVTENEVTNGIYNISKLLSDQDPENPIYLAVGLDNFYTKNIPFCKEIAPNLYKISINPFVASNSLAGRQKRWGINS